VVSCISIIIPLGLEDETSSLGIDCVHASVYVAENVREGFARACMDKLYAVT
jgi:hypothetical protein